MLLFGVAGEDLAVGEMFDGDLAIQVEAADGLDVFVEKFDADGLAVLPREDVEDAAAAGKLAATRYFWNGFVASGGEVGFEVGDVVAVTNGQGEGVAAEGLGGGDGGVELVGGENEGESLAGGEAAEDVEALGEKLGVRDTFGVGEGLELREKGGIGSPGEEVGGDFFLATGVGADDPSGLLPTADEDGGDGGLGCGGDLGESLSFELRVSIKDRLDGRKDVFGSSGHRESHVDKWWRFFRRAGRERGGGRRCGRSVGYRLGCW